MVAILKRTKFVNSTRILKEIWTAKTISRIEIAKKLKLNKSTVTNIVTELLSQEVVLLADEGDPGPKGGRKPVNLTLNKKFGFVLGIEMRPECYTVVASDLDGEVLFYKSEQMEISSENFTDCFFEILKRVDVEQNRVGIPLLGIGVGVSGIVDPVKGLIRMSIPLNFANEYNFEKEIASKFDIPVFLDNDANCCAWGELVFHRRLNLLNYIFVLVEFRNIKERQRIHEITSVGIGVVIDGKVHYGRNYLAGEFRSIFRSGQNQGQFSLSDEDVLQIEKNPVILNKFFRELCKNLSLLTNTFNLSQIFLGGDIEKYRLEITKILQEELELNWPYPSLEKREIMFSSMGDKSVAFGAAGMILNRLFVDFDLESDFPNSFIGKVFNV